MSDKPWIHVMNSVRHIDFDCRLILTNLRRILAPEYRMKTASQLMDKRVKWYRSPIIPEAIFVVAIFLAMMVQQWIQIDTFLGLVKGVIFFLIIYTQAHLHRIFVFPLLMRRRYLAYSSISVVSLFIGGIVLYMADRYWIEPDFYEKEPGVLKHILYLMIVTATSIIMIMGLYLVRQYQNELHRRSEDQILLSEMQLSLLHAQLNPHFFFNMLNNIYGVSLTKPERTPDLLLKLSKLMRYQLENGSKQMVGLSEEINFIDNYIVLEKERIGKRCQITVKFPQPSSIPANYSIAPLILITLVENAFKHSLTINSTWFVCIEMQLSGSTLQLHIRNSLPDASLRSESIGMGLKNIRQRLELLYQGRYSFDSGISGSEYITELRLELVR